MNEIIFPAGILQPPFFDNDADDAVNYGGIGAVIGHELTHGFDDQGRKFDAKGNLRDWWTPEDAKEFEERARRASPTQYSRLSTVGRAACTLNGKLTLGENTADNGGVRIALHGAEDALAGQAARRSVDGFTPRAALLPRLRAGLVPELAPRRAQRLRAQTDPHSPGAFPRERRRRPNMPEFQKAFSLQAGAADGARERLPRLVAVPTAARERRPGSRAGRFGPRQRQPPQAGPSGPRQRRPGPRAGRSGPRQRRPG